MSSHGRLEKLLNKLMREVRVLKEEVDGLKDEFAYIRERLTELEAIVEDLKSLSRERPRMPARTVMRAPRPSRRYEWVVDLVRRYGLLLPVPEGNRILLKDYTGRVVREVRREEVLESAKSELEVIEDRSGRHWLVDKRLYRRLLSKLPIRLEDLDKLSETEVKLLELLNSSGRVLLKSGTYVRAEGEG